jgi:hypothetical protein
MYKCVLRKSGEDVSTIKSLYGYSNLVLIGKHVEVASISTEPSAIYIITRNSCNLVMDSGCFRIEVAKC